METDKNKRETKAEEEKAKSTNPMDGFDFSKLLQNEGLMELLKHLLSGGGAMAANYFLWIKPLQEKNEALNTKLALQEKRITDLEEEQDRLLEQLNKEEKDSYTDKNKHKADYFDIKRNDSRSAKFRSKNVRF